MDRNKVIVKTSVFGITGNILLVFAKILVGVLAASISIVTDAVNNLTDALSSLITVIGTKLSGKRPDRKHPYGHGRIEFITSSIIGVLIFVAGATAVYESVMSLIGGDAPTYSVYSFIVISLAVLAKIGLGLYFRAQGKKVNSDALKASGIDALLDSVLSFGTLVGALVSFFFGLHLEGYIGIAIGLFIIKSSVDVFRESASKIIGERTEKELIDQISADIAKDEQVFGVYDLIINNYGADRNIGSVHVEVDDDLTAKEIQFLERRIAYLCYVKYHTVMTVGVYAKNTETELNKSIKSRVYAILSEFPEIIQIHGFYVDPEKKVISADVIISFDVKEAEKIYDTACERVSAAFPDYSVQIILDRDFSVS